MSDVKEMDKLNKLNKYYKRGREYFYAIILKIIYISIVKETKINMKYCHFYPADKYFWKVMSVGKLSEEEWVGNKIIHTMPEEYKLLCLLICTFAMIIEKFKNMFIFWTQNSTSINLVKEKYVYKNVHRSVISI